jgi:hypothetical protein
MHASDLTILLHAGMHVFPWFLLEISIGLKKSFDVDLSVAKLVSKTYKQANGLRIKALSSQDAENNLKTFLIFVRWFDFHMWNVIENHHLTTITKIYAWRERFFQNFAFKNVSRLLRKINKNAKSGLLRKVYIFLEIGRAMFRHELFNEVQLLSTIWSLCQELNMQTNQLPQTALETFCLRMPGGLPWR